MIQRLSCAYSVILNNITRFMVSYLNWVRKMCSDFITICKLLRCTWCNDNQIFSLIICNKYSLCSFKKRVSQAAFSRSFVSLPLRLLRCEGDFKIFQGTRCSTCKLFACCTLDGGTITKRIIEEVVTGLRPSLVSCLMWRGLEEIKTGRRNTSSLQLIKHLLHLWFVLAVLWSVETFN